MVAALQDAAAHADEPCPNFADGARGVLGFWPRHQAHEVTVHRWDIEVACGTPTPIEAPFAADGVDELLHCYTARYRPHLLDRPLTLSCRDEESGWSLTPAGGGRVNVERRADQTGADVEASAENLYLLLWRRLPPSAAGLRLRVPPEVLDRLLLGPVTA